MENDDSFEMWNLKSGRDVKERALVRERASYKSPSSTPDNIYG
jgi:hypothetical protein